VIDRISAHTHEQDDAMDVNADFSKRVLLHADDIEWEESPMPGVDRRRLDRVDAEEDRVTTIVRYAPGSAFSSHVHSCARPRPTWRKRITLV